MASVEKDILAELVETLSGIKIANGYSVDVVKVARHAETIAEVAPDDCPYIGVMSDGPRNKSETPGIVVTLWTIPIVAILRGTEDEAVGDAAMDLARDIERVLYVDVTRGAHAVWTRVSQSKPVRYLDRKVAQIEVEAIVKTLTTPTGANA